MKKIMPLVASIALILIAGIFASAGTIAQFTDTEEIGVDDINAGTLDLTLNGGDAVIHVKIDNIAPGWGVGLTEHCTKQYYFYLKNVGSLAGKLSMEITNLVDYENSRNDPEIEAGDTTPNVGELGQNLIMQINAPGGAGFIYLGGSREQTLAFWAAYESLGPWDISAHTQLDPLVLEFMLPWGVGNEVQSDSVEFDIIFHLDQVQPYTDETTETIGP